LNLEGELAYPSKSQSLDILKHCKISRYQHSSPACRLKAFMITLNQILGFSLYNHTSILLIQYALLNGEDLG
jgi:hypothetical protein